MSDINREEFDQLLKKVDAQQQQIDELEQRDKQKSNQIAELKQENTELKERVAELESDRDDRERRMDAYGKGIESVNDDIANLDDRLEEADPTGDAAENTPQDDWTPIERLSILGEAALAKHVSPSDRRAVTLFEHWNEWSTKKLAGSILKTADSLKSLLSTACDERLAWKQVYRACSRVEQLSKGAITFFQHDKHGWMLKQHEAFASHQATNAGVTASSVA